MVLELQSAQTYYDLILLLFLKAHLVASLLIFKVSLNVQTNPSTAVSGLVFQQLQQNHEACPFTKNEKHLKKKICAFNDYLLSRKAKCIIFILLVNKHKTDFSQHLYISEKKTQLPKMFYLLNLATPGLQLGGLSSPFHPEMWTSLEVKGQE